MLFNKLLKYCFIVLLLVYSRHVSAQDLENIPDSLYFKINGGINASTQFYTSSGMNARRDPFSYLLNANLVINVSDVISMPFSATFSSGSRTFNQPSFAIMGISPKYKAVTLHAGHRNMQFSPYTLNGISFLGGGVEVDPEKTIWRFKALAGRFAKGIPFKDDISGNVELPSYERWGWGGMVTLGKKDYSVDFILFKATDDHHSVSIPDSLNIAPKENLTFGLNTKFKLFEKLKVSTEYAGSAFTEDTRMEEVVYDRYTYLNNMGNLFVPRQSSSYSNAYSFKVDYGGETFSVGASFQRVDPEYKTLGSTYMSNDFRNITLNASKSLLESKLTLSGNCGFQKNNLAGDKEQTTNRAIASVQGSFNISENWNIAGNYSNFSTESNPTYINLVDSIRYMQVTENYGGMVSYSTASEVLTHTAMLNVTVQSSDMLNNSATEVTETNTLSRNAMLSYTMGVQPLQLTLNSSLNATVFESEGNSSRTMGPVVSLQRPFLKKKINTTVSWSRMMTMTDGRSNSTSVVRMNVNYRFLPKHTIKLTASSTFLNRHVREGEEEGYVRKKSNETRLMLNYGFNF